MPLRELVLRVTGRVMNNWEQELRGIAERRLLGSRAKPGKSVEFLCRFIAKPIAGRRQASLCTCALIIQTDFVMK